MCTKNSLFLKFIVDFFFPVSERIVKHYKYFLFVSPLYSQNIPNFRMMLLLAAPYDFSISSTALKKFLYIYFLHDPMNNENNNNNNKTQREDPTIGFFFQSVETYFYILSFPSSSSSSSDVARTERVFEFFLSFSYKRKFSHIQDF